MERLPNPDIWLFAQSCLDERYARLFGSATWPDTLTTSSISATRVWWGTGSISAGCLSNANTALVLLPAATRDDAEQCLQVVAEALRDRKPTRVLVVAPMRLPLLASHSSTAEWSPQLPFTMLVSNAASCAADSLSDGRGARRRTPAPVSGVVTSGITRALHWFDPLQPPRTSTGELPHGASYPDQLRDAFLQIDEFDRAAGSLGILPESLRSVLRWRDQNGAPCSLKLLDRMLVLLRAAIFDHALCRWANWQRLTSLLERARKQRAA